MKRITEEERTERLVVPGTGWYMDVAVEASTGLKFQGANDVQHVETFAERAT